jgi:Methyltransferase domain
VTEGRQNPGPVELDALLADELEPVFWTPELLNEESPFWPHVPFVFWLVAATRPRLVVELGMDQGVSYAAFCEAARRLQLDASFHAVDLWRDAEGRGQDGDADFDDFTKFHDFRYKAFSHLMRLPFAQARENFADGSIDLLHVNACGRGVDVEEDILAWRGKFSPRGVLILHGASPYLDLEKILGDAPHFAFTRGEGLIVAALGRETPPAVAQLCALDEEKSRRVRERFGLLGARWTETATILDLLRQFEREFQAEKPRDRDFRLTVADRFWNSFVKTAANPFRHFEPKRRKK